MTTPANLSAVVQAHSDRWEVGQEPDTGVWFASRTTHPDRVHVVVDHTLAGLRQLDVEGTSS